MIADVDQDNRVDYEEFVSFYQSLATTKARRELRSALGPQAESMQPPISLITFLDPSTGKQHLKIPADMYHQKAILEFKVPVPRLYKNWMEMIVS